MRTRGASRLRRPTVASTPELHQRCVLADEPPIDVGAAVAEIEAQRPLITLGTLVMVLSNLNT